METNLEYILTHYSKADMIAHIKSHPEKFEELVTLAISDKQPFSWRAAWLLWSCMEKNDQRIHKYLDKIINTIPSKPDNQVREFLIILQQIELSDHEESRLFDLCINIWKKTDKQASVRYNAFKLMIMIAQKHAGLLGEITLLTESQYTDSLSNNAKKSILKMVTEIEK
ncbi:hypothetical protein E9993_01280 [Labilibacter sediminis]|nr:hypothetical protein E9993_01280 [Labilibacter sediminis]